MFVADHVPSLVVENMLWVFIDCIAMETSDIGCYGNTIDPACIQNKTLEKH